MSAEPLLSQSPSAPEAEPKAMWLGPVRRWSLAQGISAQTLQTLARNALLLSTSRLIQGIAREKLCELEVEPTCVLVGKELGPRIVFPAFSALYGRWEALAPPYLQDPHREKIYKLETAGAFLRAVVRAVPALATPPLAKHLREDFHNSFANLLLNRVLAHLQRANTWEAPEPAYIGHHTFPFPALRRGPALADIVACSHLNVEPVQLPVLVLGELVQDSAGRFDLYGDALGLRRSSVLPVHPWQLTVSPVVRHLLERGQARMCEETVLAWPLASQRTFRVVATGYDIKLPVDADITGERRLLFRLNCRNATPVSALIKSVVARDAIQARFTGQYDVATLYHPADVLSPSLAAIVRAPALDEGYVCHAAINLWTGRLDARNLVPTDALGAEEFLLRYCQALLYGPMHLVLRRRMATEPHLQNSIMCFKGKWPEKLMLRDLDATVLERARWEAYTRSDFAPETWHHMPSFAIGAKRTIHAMFFGHLGCVADFMTHSRELPMTRVSEVIDSVWHSLVGSIATSKAQIQFADWLLNARQAVRVSLMARLRREPGLHFLPR